MKVNLNLGPKSWFLNLESRQHMTFLMNTLKNLKTKFYELNLIRKIRFDSLNLVFKFLNV